jgi:hypothetical protein
LSKPGCAKSPSRNNPRKAASMDAARNHLLRSSVVAAHVGIPLSTPKARDLLILLGMDAQQALAELEAAEAIEKEIGALPQGPRSSGLQDAVDTDASSGSANVVPKSGLNT